MVSRCRDVLLCVYSLHRHGTKCLEVWSFLILVRHIGAPMMVDRSIGVFSLLLFCRPVLSEIVNGARLAWRPDGSASSQPILDSDMSSHGAVELIESWLKRSCFSTLFCPWIGSRAWRQRAAKVVADRWPFRSSIERIQSLQPRFRCQKRKSASGEIECRLLTFR